MLFRGKRRFAKKLTFVRGYVDKETSSRYTIHESTVVLIDYLFADHREFYDKELVIPANVKVIESEAFSGISQLHKITLEEGVEIVESRAFSWRDDAMTTVILPSSLRRISEHGFSNSDLMTHIAYKGTMAQWEQVELVKDSIYSAGGYQILCTDGTIKP